jgi:hypothetical protein
LIPPAKVMADRSRLVRQIFEAIENNDDGHYLWDLLEQIATTSNDGVVYMTYAGETPQSSAKKFNRHHLLKLIQLHQKLTFIRAQFPS